MEKPVHFIVIDDDPINNMICTHTIKSVTGETGTKCFTVPEEGLSFIEHDFFKANGTTAAILFLDINMPSMTGWDVLDKLKHVEPKNLNNLSIYILSSSVNQQDQEQAHNNPLVTDYIVKPLTREKLQNLLGSAQLTKAV